MKQAYHFWISVVLLAIASVLTVWAYWPSLEHAPKHDQISYLAETARFNSPSEILQRTISLNRTRIFMGRDELFFRPLLNLWLGMQRVLFGYNFPLWQVVGIALHLLVGLALFGLLNFIRPGIPAAVVTGSFLLLLSNIPMVVWHHINAYMLFWALILLALRQYAVYLRSPEKTDAIWTCAWILLPSVFIFEAGILFSICLAAGILLFRKDKRLSGILLLPVLIYAILSSIDFLVRHPAVNSEMGRVIFKGFSIKTLLNGLVALKWFVTAGIFTHPKDILVLERVVLAPWTLGPFWPLTSMSPCVWRGLCVVILFGVMFAVARSTSREDWFLARVIGLMIIVLLLFISVGRVNTRGVLTGLFFFNSYYVYFFWVLFLPLLYVCVDFTKVSARTDGGIIRLAIYLLAAGILFINILSTHNVNRYIAQVDHPRKVVIETIDSFIKEHSGEEKLTFYMPHTCPGNYPGNWLHKKTDPLWRRYTLAEVLFPKYYASRQTAKYILRCQSFAKNPSF